MRVRELFSHERYDMPFFSHGSSEATNHRLNHAVRGEVKREESRERKGGKESKSIKIEKLIITIDEYS